MTWVDNKDFKHQMDKSKRNQPQDMGEDLFSASSDELLSTREASELCGVSYDKFLRNYWQINYKYLYPGGPRLYLRTEVQAFIEGENK